MKNERCAVNERSGIPDKQEIISRRITDMTKLPVAVQVYSVRDSAEKNLADTLKKIKEMGCVHMKFCSIKLKP